MPPSCILFLVQSGESSIWRVAWRWEEEGRGGKGEWRQSPPVSRAKQHHGNGLMLWGDEWQPVCQPPPERERGERSPSSGPAWHSRLGEQIPLLQLFSQGSCWHSHFGAPAKDTTAYLRTEQRRSTPENYTRTGRSVHFWRTGNAHVSCWWSISTSCVILGKEH